MVVGIRRGVLAALVVAFVGSWAVAETFEEVEQKIKDAAKNTKSLTAKHAMEMKTEQPQFSMSMKSEGTFEQLRQGEKMMMRHQQVMNIEQKFGDQENKSKQEVLLVSDGDVTYTLSDNDGTKTCMKTKAMNMEDMPWSQMRADFDIKLLEDAQVDGADCYTIELTPKDKSQAAMFSRAVYNIRKDCGFMVKYLTFDGEGKQASIMTFSDVKVNPDIPADHFKFEAPAGVQVIDQTAGAPAAP